MDNNYLKEELETLLRQDPRMWTFLQEGSLDGVWYWDLEKPDNEWMSPEMWQLFGIDPATKRHDPAEWKDMIFADDLATAMANFDAHCADPDVPYDQVVRYRHADGSVVWVRCRGIAIRNEAGAPIRMLGAHNDLTAVKKSEIEARKFTRQAQTANADLRAFAYSVSHDMKAPANTLELLLAELQHQIAPVVGEDAADLLSLSMKTVNRMQRLIDDVIDYTRVVGLKPNFETVELSKCMDAAIMAINDEIKEQQAVVHVGPLPALHVDEVQITVLFQNLLSNALKFNSAQTPPRIEVTCATSPATNTVDICFQDNGIGIPAEAQTRIFELFQRLHTRDIYAGSGIGLPLCKRIAQNHNGDLSVQSELGKGAAFTINLPRSA